MKGLLALCLALGLTTVVTTGCEKKAEVKKTTTVTTPDGSATRTQTDKIETKGDNPPAAK
ncbi:MAG: hypothetical protein HYX69_09605 [Planctomycetia bacterium]|nr:hypothetical protein [Planctomycetia bacterium]